MPAEESTDLWRLRAVRGIPGMSPVPAMDALASCLLKDGGRLRAVLVLKTRSGDQPRGFESHALRQALHPTFGVRKWSLTRTVSADGSLEEAERVPGRVKQDPDVLLGLVVGQGSARSQGPGDSR